MRCAVCRCLRGALRSASSTASRNSRAAFIFQRGRSSFFRGFGSALPIASRTIRRCTPNFWATPAIVPTPNSYSRRICSNNSTLALQSNESPLLRASPDSEYPFAKEVGQNKMPNWARSEYRNHQQSEGVQLLQPLALQYVGLASRQRLCMPRIHHVDLKSV